MSSWRFASFATSRPRPPAGPQKPASPHAHGTAANAAPSRLCDGGRKPYVAPCHCRSVCQKLAHAADARGPHPQCKRDLNHGGRLRDTNWPPAYPRGRWRWHTSRAVACDGTWMGPSPFTVATAGARQESGWLDRREAPDAIRCRTDAAWRVRRPPALRAQGGMASPRQRGEPEPKRCSRGHKNADAGAARQPRDPSRVSGSPTGFPRKAVTGPSGPSW